MFFEKLILVIVKWENDSMVLFIVPHAGASVLAYSGFKKIIENKNESVEVVLIELPGRGRKSGEPLQRNMQGLLNCILDKIKNKINNSDDEYVFYGHSMGGLIAYEVVANLMMDNEIKRKPKKLIVTCRRSPLCQENTFMYKLPDKEFIDVVKSYGFSTSNEMFEDLDICKYFIPILRSDFELVEEYRHNDKTIPAIEATIFWGEKDKSLSEQLIESWNDAIKGECKIIRKQGGHFFNFENADAFSEELIGEIC